jgi:homoserine O-acetyltransferase/O-succinyltransferase
MQKIAERGSAGIVSTQYFTFAEPPDELELDSGERLGPITLAYETYGTLNAARDNAILVLHALSGDAHAAGISANLNGVSAAEPGMDGINAQDDLKRRLGWWDNMIGPGKAFDTDRYFVISSNVIGGCRGSTGPSSIDPRTGRPYGLSFPVVTIGDMVRAQKHLVDHLGVERLLAVTGGSMGGMQALEWAVSYPERVVACIPVATSARLSAQAIAFNEVGRLAIMQDPSWQKGDYYGKATPRRGLALARMVGHITYMSDASMNDKFGRRLKNGSSSFKFSPEFEVEGYLQYRGDNFIKRFDPNSYLYITKAIDYFDLANGKSLAETFRRIKARMLVIAFKSDWLYPAYQSQEIARACKRAGVQATYCELNSTYGHDAFLVEADEQTYLISHFLKKVRHDAA